MRTEELKLLWNKVTTQFSESFADGVEIDVEGILFLIGIQETGKGFKKYKKDEKINIIHVAICTLLAPYGYYEYEGIDQDGWPHFKVLDKLPALKPGEQSLLMKEAIVNYAIKNEWLAP